MWPQWLRGARRGLGCDGDPIEQTPDNKLAHAEAVRVRVVREDGYPASLLFGSGSDSSGSARTIRSANATCSSFSGWKKAKLCAFCPSCSGETVSKSCPKKVTNSAAEPIRFGVLRSSGRLLKQHCIDQRHCRFVHWWSAMSRYRAC